MSDDLAQWRKNEPLRILVTGSRYADQYDAAFVWRWLNDACGMSLDLGTPVVIVQGECHKGGVDRAAQVWAEIITGATSEGHPADWKTHGRAAGAIRNAEMVKLGADLCLAFPRPNSTGTWDCIRKAANAGIKVRIYPMATWASEESETDS